MRISPELEWIRPFVELVSPKLPHIKLLDSIKSRRPKENCSENQTFHGQITKWYDGEKHLITLYTHYLKFTIKKNDNVEIEIKPYTTLDILKHLAHELAHLEHWDHNAFHWALENELGKVFAVKLALDGYTREED